MVVDLHSARLIKAADTYSHPIAEHLFAHAERAAASGTKGPLGEDWVERYQVGCALSHVDELAGKCTNASAGAPECLRHTSRMADHATERLCNRTIPDRSA